MFRSGRDDAPVGVERGERLVDRAVVALVVDDDLRPAGDPPGETDREPVRVGRGDRELPERQAEPAGELLARRDRVLGREHVGDARGASGARRPRSSAPARDRPSPRCRRGRGRRSRGRRRSGSGRRRPRRRRAGRATPIRSSSSSGRRRGARPRARSCRAAERGWARVKRSRSAAIAGQALAVDRGGDSAGHEPEDGQRAVASADPPARRRDAVESRRRTATGRIARWIGQRTRRLDRSTGWRDRRPGWPRSGGRDERSVECGA